MPLSVGDIYFTSLITDSDVSVLTGQESFSFVVTTDVASGETITFHQPESIGDSSFTYTVGALGLSAGDRVTIREISTGNTMEILHDPSGGAVSAVSGQSFSITATDELIASQGGQVLAAISNGGLWDQGHLGVAGLSRSDLDTWVANNPGLASPAIENLDGGSGVDDNLMFIGGNILLHGDDPAYWTGTNDGVLHTNPNVNGTTYATQDSSIFLCFAKGTRIATPSGDTAVEDLKIGDSATTGEGREVAVKWIGHQTVSTRFGPAERLMPVRFAAGSLGEGVPHEPLTVTADHGILVDGVICHAGALVNGTTIMRVPLADMGEAYTVYHVETEEHEIILANGARAETFIDNVSRRVFDNYAEFEALYGDVPEMEELPFPRAMSARQVPERVLARVRPPACA
jgi:hypothetical protein